MIETIIKKLVMKNEEDYKRKLNELIILTVQISLIKFRISNFSKDLSKKSNI